MSPRADLLPDPVAPKQRKGRKVNPSWREDFLEAYQTHGGLYASAETAGVNSSTVYDEMARDPAFKHAAEEARQRFCDSREQNLMKLANNGNVVGDIVLLKAHRPDRYIEKNLSITATFSASLDEQQGGQLLQAMLQEMTGASAERIRVLPPAPDSTGNATGWP